jgi:hypothetical protein
MRGVPEELRFQGVVPSVPKRCSNCSRVFTVAYDPEGSQVFFCANRACDRRGFGFRQDRTTGVILDGMFTEHYDYLERHRF